MTTADAVNNNMVAAADTREPQIIRETVRRGQEETNKTTQKHYFER